jgi:single-stranded-DNA-specific exonuclease
VSSLSQNPVSGNLLPYSKRSAGLDASLASIAAKPRIICLSHKEDVDGVASAVLIKSAYKSATSVVLVDYANIISILHRMTSLFSSFNQNGKSGMVFICDLGLSKKNEKEFLKILTQIMSTGYKVTYIDHHDLSQDTELALRKMGVTLMHSIDECTSVLIYSKFKRRLNPQAAFYAAAGALTDYMDNKPVASCLVSRFDRQFLMLESTVLSYMISANQRDDHFLYNLVDSLSQMKYPHEIEGSFSIARKYACKVWDSVKSIQTSIIKRTNLAYVHSNLDLSASMVVNFVLGISGMKAALVYKFRDEINSYVVSIRGSKDCKVHLGKLVNDISLAVGGSGGGHERACGAVVPKDKLDEFIERLDNNIK